MPESPSSVRPVAAGPWLIHDQALAVLDKHLPAAQGCLRCRRPWPCDASRLAAAVAELLPSLLRAAPPTADPPPPLRRW